MKRSEVYVGRYYVIKIGGKENPVRLKRVYRHVLLITSCRTNREIRLPSARRLLRDAVPADFEAWKLPVPADVLNPPPKPRPRTKPVKRTAAPVVIEAEEDFDDPFERCLVYGKTAPMIQMQRRCPHSDGYGRSMFGSWYEDLVSPYRTCKRCGAYQRRCSVDHFKANMDQETPHQ